MSEMTEAEQRAVWIGERLFDRWLEKWKYAGGVFAAMQWIQSLDGVHDVKTAMIERGYDIVVGRIKMDEFPWQCCIYEEYYRDHEDPITGYANTEAEAVLMAVEKALKSEEK